MKRAILFGSAGVLVVSLVWLAMSRPEPAMDTLQPRPDSAAREADALRADVRALQANLARQPGHSQWASASPFESERDELVPQAAEAERAELVEVEAAAAVAGNRDAEYRAHLARVAARYDRLAGAFKSQPREPRWAQQHEQQILELPARHEYFRDTKLREVECRSDWCRVIAEFANEADQGTFEETFAGFAPGFSSGTMRTVADAIPPRTEVYLARAGAGAGPGALPQ